MNILAIDVGGTHIKFCTQRHPDVIKIVSGPRLSPAKMVKLINDQSVDRAYDRVSIGFPGPVIHDQPLREPFNLGKGWVKFKWKEAFSDKPMRMLNDAAMQALGSYNTGRMLFLGLGTGLGSAMVVDGIVQPMELAHLPYKKGKTYEDFLGLKALEHDGRKRWRKHVLEVIKDLSDALQADNVVLGGGNAKLMTELPAHIVVGNNANAIKGAFLLWDTKSQASRLLTS